MVLSIDLQPLVIASSFPHTSISESLIYATTLLLLFF